MSAVLQCVGPCEWATPSQFATLWGGLCDIVPYQVPIPHEMEGRPDQCRLRFLTIRTECVPNLVKQTYMRHSISNSPTIEQYALDMTQAPVAHSPLLEVTRRVTRYHEAQGSGPWPSYEQSNCSEDGQDPPRLERLQSDNVEHRCLCW